MTQNNFPMREWHIKNMEKTVIKYVKGLPEDASRFEKRIHKKYGKINQVYRSIDYDVKHGVLNEEILSFLQKLRTESEYSKIRECDGSIERLNEIESHFV